jgi:hypothetical protein
MAIYNSNYMEASSGGCTYGGNKTPAHTNRVREFIQVARLIPSDQHQIAMDDMPRSIADAVKFDFLRPFCTPGLVGHIAAHPLLQEVFQACQNAPGSQIGAAYSAALEAKNQKSSSKQRGPAVITANRKRLPALGVPV